MKPPSIDSEAISPPGSFAWSGHDRAHSHMIQADYHGGTSAVLPIGANGELGKASDVHRHNGALGPRRAMTSFAPESNGSSKSSARPWIKPLSWTLNKYRMRANRSFS